MVPAQSARAHRNPLYPFHNRTGSTVLRLKAAGGLVDEVFLSYRFASFWFVSYQVYVDYCHMSSNTYP